jgi:hypothetical protein
MKVPSPRASLIGVIIITALWMHGMIYLSRPVVNRLVDQYLPSCHDTVYVAAPPLAVDTVFVERVSN